MTVQVQIAFNSVDEAIVALGRLVGGKIANVATAGAASAAGDRGLQPVTGTDPRNGGQQAPAATSTTAPAALATRKPRSDRGQPRGPHKTTGEPVASEPGVPQTASAATAQPAAPAAPTTTAAPEKAPADADKASPSGAKPAPAAATIPSADDVQKAVEKLFNAKGFEDCALVLSRFGVKRGKDLLPEQRADFIAKTDRVTAGEAP